MSAELSERVAGWESVRNALAEIHASRDGLEEFFSEMLDELSSLSTELAARGQQWESQRRQTAQDQHNHKTATTAGEQQLKQTLDEARQQQTLLEQERTVLEVELEAVRNRAAETAELLAEQKHQTTQQHTLWNRELKQMRCLLENISTRLAQTEAVASAGRSGPAEPAAAAAAAVDSLSMAADPALDSVMAQFEMLQKDLAKRRADNS